MIVSYLKAGFSCLLNIINNKMGSDKLHIEADIQERVNGFLNNPQQHLGNTLGIEFTSFKRDEIRARMPVDERTIQPFGILHGGASVVLAETLASIGAWLNTGENEHKMAVGVEINANHIRPVPLGGAVTAVSVPVHRGNRIQVWETKIYNSEEKLVCVSRCTLTTVNSKR